jgi:asparagine synthase (glutamine-hydrolysing)
MKVLDQKHLLKQAVKGLIPESIRMRHKQPYRAPEGKSFFVRKDGYIGDLLTSSRLKQDGIFNPKSTEALMNKFRSGRETSLKDNMALIGILSTTLLLDCLVKRRPSAMTEVPYKRPAQLRA